MTEKIQLPEEIITSKIYEIRNLKVMIDRDLAELYGVNTKALKQTVRRNLQRFPEDFMFEMNDDEFIIWRSQFVTSKSDKQGLRYKPFCFTEQGVTMLSCILNSQRAIEVNIRIVRIFTKMREMLITHKDILIKLDEIERKDIEQDEKIMLIFEYIKQFEAIKQQELEQQNRPRIGYKLPEKDK